MAQRPHPALAGSRSSGSATGCQHRCSQAAFARPSAEPRPFAPRCVSVEIHPVFLPHTPCQPGASPPPGELAGSALTRVPLPAASTRWRNPRGRVLPMENSASRVVRLTDRQPRADELSPMLGRHYQEYDQGLARVLTFGVTTWQRRMQHYAARASAARSVRVSWASQLCGAVSSWCEPQLRG